VRSVGHPEVGNSCAEGSTASKNRRLAGAVCKVDFKLLRVMRFPMRWVLIVYRQASQWNVPCVGFNKHRCRTPVPRVLRWNSATA